MTADGLGLIYPVMGDQPDLEPRICEAIRTSRRLEFEYDGRQRLVEPYCHGIGKQGHEMLRAVQVGGSTRPGGFGFGKLWTVSKISQLRLAENFVDRDPHYNPNDSAMSEIHCRVVAAR